MFIQRDVANVRLNPRSLPEDIILTGTPELAGRILSVTDDKRVARVAWRMTTGAVKMGGVDPDTSDLMYILEGGCELRVAGQPPIVANAGDWVETPRVDFELHVPELLHKISVIYNPNGLTLQAEP